MEFHGKLTNHNEIINIDDNNSDEEIGDESILIKNFNRNMLTTATTKDWRKALRSQPAYRIVNRTIRGQTQFITILILIGLLMLFLYYLLPKSNNTLNHLNLFKINKYNSTYPLTTPIKTLSMHTFRIGIISDLDTNSKIRNQPNQWYSNLKKGYLSFSPIKKTVVITWDSNAPIKLISSYSLKGRGMELSELIVFNGKLLTFDDRTGLVFEIVDNQIIPWVLLMDGDGRNTKGFKSEWATVKDELLYVGSMGKEWTTPDGRFENNNPQYIKTVTINGEVNHINWIKEYKYLRETLDIYWPGYMIHESGVWSNVHKRWFFLPRRCSKQPYNETLDEHRGCSVLISANANFSNIKITQIENSQRHTRGFSSFKFIPTSNDEIIVALRTEELNGNTSTFITVFTIYGHLIMDDNYISDLKYEGLEFI